MEPNSNCSYSSPWLPAYNVSVTAHEVGFVGTCSLPVRPSYEFAVNNSRKTNKQQENEER